MARRLEPGWNFSTLYLIKDSLAIMLEAAGLLEDAFREYFELEACYLEALKQGGNLAGRPFGRFLCMPARLCISACMALCMPQMLWSLRAGLSMHDPLWFLHELARLVACVRLQVYCRFFPHMSTGTQ